MIQVDPLHPDPALFRGCRSYRSAKTITAVQLRERVALVTLLGTEYGEVGDYLTRDRQTGCAAVVDKALFEATYHVERELDGAVAKPVRKGMVIA